MPDMIHTSPKFEELSLTFGTHLNKAAHLVKTPPLQTCEVCVIIPVRNEAANLSSTLASLLHQVDLQGNCFDYKRYEVLLLANNCTDNTVEVACTFARLHPKLQLHIIEYTLEPEKAHVGWARKLLMDEACRRLLSLGHNRGVIASTDGDTIVSPDWLASNLREITSGADGVGGRIIIQKSDRENFSARSFYLRDNGYRFLVSEMEYLYGVNPHENWPSHHQHFGASFAITAQMYQRVGGLPPLAALEDAALYRSILRVDGVFRHSMAVRVYTSGREQGRTPFGLAPQLRYWLKLKAEKQVFLVESVQAIEARLKARQCLYVVWQQIKNGSSTVWDLQQEIRYLSHELAVTYEWLVASLSEKQPFGALYESVQSCQQSNGIWSQRWPQVGMEQAIEDLRIKLELMRCKDRLTNQNTPYFRSNTSKR